MNEKDVLENTNLHDIYVKQLNQIEKSSTAAVHPNFSQMSLTELNLFAGRNKYIYYPRIKDIDDKGEREINSEKEEDLSIFLKNFDWMSLLRHAGSQGLCGSCYAYTTIRIIEARLTLHYKHEVKLSVQHPMDCSIYNQGCEGGYPFLVTKFADESELLPEKCKPYLVKLIILFIYFIVSNFDKEDDKHLNISIFLMLRFLLNLN